MNSIQHFIDAVEYLEWMWNDNFSLSLTLTWEGCQQVFLICTYLHTCVYQVPNGNGQTGEGGRDNLLWFATLYIE